MWHGVKYPERFQVDGHKIAPIRSDFSLAE